MRGDNDIGMTFIVKTVTRLTLGFILLYGVYIGLAGHGAPGGGFTGGVIIALSLVHVMLAFGKETALRRLHPVGLRISVCAAGLLFLFFVMVRPGFRSGRIFNNEIIMPVCEMAIVGLGLFAIFVSLVMMTKPDREAG